MPSLLAKLRDGDRRSIGQVDRVVRMVLKKPELVKCLITALSSKDPLLRMRSADALEKISKQNLPLIQKYRRIFTRLSVETDQSEVRWHLAQIIPRLELSIAERGRVIRTFRKWTHPNEKSQIVRVSAMQALWDLGVGLKEAERALQDRSPAMRARARKLLASEK